MPTAIVLSLTKYSDTGSIVHLYTAEQGRMQYAVYGNKYKGILRPLSIVEFTTTKRKNAPQQMGSLSSASLLYTPQLLATDVRRQCVAMFIAEILSTTLRHPMSDQPLFDWLCAVIQHLDTDTDISNLHLHFLIEYATDRPTMCLRRYAINPLKTRHKPVTGSEFGTESGFLSAKMHNHLFFSFIICTFVANLVKCMYHGSIS